jgi:flagellar protein FliO/FliZ
MKLSSPFKTAAVAACLLLAGAPSALAAGGEKTPLDLGRQLPTGHASTSSGSGSLVRTFVGLAVVLAVIYGLYWVLKQVKASRSDKSSGRGLSSIATLPLGTNRSLQVVRAGSEFVLLGVSEHGVTPIRTYSEREAQDAGLLDDEFTEPDAAPATGGFGGVFDELRRRTVRR